MIEDRRTILRPGVIALAIERGRIVDHEEHLQDLLERHLPGVEGELRYLGMAGFPRADLLVTGVRRRAAHITRLDRIHALEVVEYGLQAPETASGKSGDFLHCLGHIVLPFFAVGVLFCQIEADRITVCRIRSAAKPGARCLRVPEESNMSLPRGLLAAALLVHALACAGQQPAPGQAVATFAGGCFWCMEPPYHALPGVISTTSGYMGGTQKNPSYEEVSSGTTGHAEVVQVVYDPKKVTYEKLLEVFWKNVDPTVRGRQFCDIGSQYRTAIFYHTDEQRRLAEISKGMLAKAKPFKDDIVTPVVPAAEFWRAEDYHQDFYVKNPVRYKFYRTGCGRDARLKQLWGSVPH